jgi:NADPH:quinone reductase-like Zn-dependent oxidoreductase
VKALVFKRYGGPDQVAFADTPRPVPKPNEILVQVHAAGLNPIDTMIPKGTFKRILRFQLPATLGSDVAGVVVEVGSGVTRFKPGDAVFASIFDLGTGALAEGALVPENAAALKPANLDFVQAASIPMVGLTSWQALKDRAHLKPGQKVFIPAGAGGIGTFAIQLSRDLGAKVGTTTSPDPKFVPAESHRENASEGLSHASNGATCPRLPSIRGGPSDALEGTEPAAGGQG